MGHATGEKGHREKVKVSARTATFSFPQKGAAVEQFLGTGVSQLRIRVTRHEFLLAAREGPTKFAKLTTKVCIAFCFRGVHRSTADPHNKPGN